MRSDLKVGLNRLCHNMMIAREKNKTIKLNIFETDCPLYDKPIESALTDVTFPYTYFQMFLLFLQIFSYKFRCLYNVLRLKALKIEYYTLVI